jgi:two-component system, cell cycle response regulator
VESTPIRFGAALAYPDASAYSEIGMGDRERASARGVVRSLAQAGILSMLGAAALFGRRQEDDSRVADALDAMRGRVDELARDLGQALERAEGESRRNRLLAELSSSIDLDELLERVLTAAAEVGGFEAGRIVLEEPGTPSVVVTRGLTADEAANPPTPGSGQATGTIVVSYRFGAADPSDAAPMLRGGAFVPLIGRDHTALGTLALFWRRTTDEPTSDDIAAAEQIATLSMPALENARRYREARQLAETDALTSLFNQRYFHEMLRREVQRAHRYGRSLALVVFDLDDFKSINDRLGHLAGDGVIAHAAERLTEAVRGVDIACRIGGDEFAVILPESSVADADQLYGRVHDAVAASTVGPSQTRLRLSAGIAELRHGDTAASLFDRADAALYRAKGAGKGRVDIATDVEPDRDQTS